MSYERTLFGEIENIQVVNVASVPQRSPFRYPGGKTWLIPHIRKWLRSRLARPTELIEPFAGGGIVSLTAAFEHLCEKATMVELDEEVAAVWHTILKSNGEWLAERIITFDFTPETVAYELSRPTQDLREKAFKTLLRNRVNHGGILAPGSGLIKNGENGKGLKSRWYPTTLKQRIIDIIRVKDRIDFIEADGMDVLKWNTNRKDAVFFIDPPYTAPGKRAGRRLYTYNELDHEELFRIVANLGGDFLMTYDNANSISRLAAQYGFDTEIVAMKNTHHARMMELLIGRDLSWARHPNSSY